VISIGCFMATVISIALMTGYNSPMKPLYSREVLSSTVRRLHCPSFLRYNVRHTRSESFSYLVVDITNNGSIMFSLYWANYVNYVYHWCWTLWKKDQQMSAYILMMITEDWCVSLSNLISFIIQENNRTDVKRIKNSCYDHVNSQYDPMVYVSNFRKSIIQKDTWRCLAKNYFKTRINLNKNINQIY